MAIPLYIFLIGYLILAGISSLYALLSLWHVFRFSHMDVATYFTTGIFVAGLILIGFVSASFILPIDWTSSVQLFSTTTNSSPTLGL